MLKNEIFEKYIMRIIINTLIALEKIKPYNFTREINKISIYITKKVSNNKLKKVTSYI